MAIPAVPVPGFTASEPDPDELVVETEEVVDPDELVFDTEEVVDPSELELELLVELVEVGDHSGWFHGNGADNVVMAQKPMITRAIKEEPKECMAGNEF